MEKKLSIWSYSQKYFLPLLNGRKIIGYKWDLSWHLHIIAILLVLIAYIVLICKWLWIKVSAKCKYNVNTELQCCMHGVLYCYFMEKNTMEVNGCRQLFGTTWSWVNDDIIFYLWMNCPYLNCKNHLNHLVLNNSEDFKGWILFQMYKKSNLQHGACVLCKYMLMFHMIWVCVCVCVCVCDRCATLTQHTSCLATHQTHIHDVNTYKVIMTADSIL